MMMSAIDATHDAEALASSLQHKTTTKILIYGMNYSPEVAGVGKYTGEIAEHFSKEGAEILVVTTPPHYPGWAIQDGFRNRYSSEVTNGISVIRVPLLLRSRMRGIWRLVAPLSFALTSAPVVFWQILRHRPDTVFCVEPTLFAAPIAQLAAKLAGSKTVLHVQDLEIDAAFAVGHLRSLKWLKKLGYAFERAVLKRFDSIVTISSRMGEKLETKGVVPEKLSIIRNWVDLQHIFPMTSPSPYRAELGYADDDFIVLYSGNIGAKQGLNIVVDAARIIKDNTRVKFIVAGEGPAKEVLRDTAHDLPNIRFLPFQPYSRLNEFLNLADLHILPQERGAADLVLPSKLGSMLATGKPILITADDDTELATFAHGAAHIVAPGDPYALAANIVETSKSMDLDGYVVMRADLAQNLSKGAAVNLLYNIVKRG